MLNIKLLFSFLFGYCMVGWDFCFRLLSFLIVRVFKLIVLVFGGLYELSMVRRFKELFLRIGYRFFSQGSFDFRYYFLNVVVDLFFLGYSFFLIVGNNVRFESPIIMSRLRRIFFLRRIVVFLLGLGLELLTFLVINIGNSFEFFIRILEYLYIRFFCVIQMLLILGTNFIYRSDWSKIYYLIYLLCAFGVIYVYIHYTFIFLHFFEFGLQFFSESGKLSANGMERFIYLIGSDEIRDTCFVRESFVAYQGGYGETGALFALVIIPVKIIFEVTGYFINTIGMVLDVNECLDILGNLLKDDEIFFLLGEYIGWEIYVYGFFFLLFEIFLFMGLLDCWHIFKNIFFLMIG